jgi:hypothetical protein
MLWLPWVTSWALAAGRLGPWRLLPNLHWKFITGNLILEFTILVLRPLYGMRCGEVLGLRWQDVDLVRSFRWICDHNNLCVIKFHHLRHTTASLLKKLSAPVRLTWELLHPDGSRIGSRCP